MSDNPNEAPDTAGAVVPPPLIYGVALVIGLLAKPCFRPLCCRARLLGLPLLGGGLLLFLSSLRTIRHADTDVRPDKPTTSLVVEGPYRFTRNPIYLGCTLFYSGITILVVMRRGVIEREERYLERIFGEEYVQYRSRVRR